jgi:hypothetical protein
VERPLHEPASARSDLRRERIIFETERHRIEGSLTLPREGYRSRLSDYLNQRDREFFPVEDAVLSGHDRPEDTRSVPFLMVARAHIRLVVPVEEEQPQSEQVERARGVGPVPDA